MKQPIIKIKRASISSHGTFEFVLKNANIYNEEMLKMSREMKDAHEAPLAEPLAIANGRARERTTNARDVFNALKRTEELLTMLGIPHKAVEGQEFYCDPNGTKFAGAYKYTPYSTVLHITYKKGCYYITPRREGVGNGDTKVHFVGGIPPAALEYVRKNF